MLQRKYKSTVVSINNPFEGIYTIEFAPERGKFKYTPGPFLHIALDEDYDGSSQKVFAPYRELCTMPTVSPDGTKLAFTRLTAPDDYEQAILKFMVTDQCDYITAQGNMDAYLRNPPDWQYQRMEDMKNGYEKQRDYVTIKVSDIVLVLTWSTIVVAVIGRVIYSVTNGVDFVSGLLF